MRNIAFLALIFGAFIFTTSCKKIEEPTALNVIENAGTATINGVAFANSDLGEPGNEFAKAGTKLTVVINPASFPGATTYTGNNNLLVYTTTVGANGQWSVTVKAPKAQINATIASDDYRQDLINTATTPTTILQENKIWTLNATNVTVWEGNTTEVNITYN
jgi:hypothetical protein